MVKNVFGIQVDHGIEGDPVRNSLFPHHIEPVILVNDQFLLCVYCRIGRGMEGNVRLFKKMEEEIFVIGFAGFENDHLLLQQVFLQ